MLSRLWFFRKYTILEAKASIFLIFEPYSAIFAPVGWDFQPSAVRFLDFPVVKIFLLARGPFIATESFAITAEILAITAESAATLAAL